MFAVSAFGQDIAIGTWRTHFSYNDARILAVSNDKIFCASENGFFSRELSTGILRKLSKIDGLSDVGISAMAYSEEGAVLVVGYRSGSVDFIFEDRILTASDIANSNLEGDKKINDIAFSGNRVFLATDLGIVVFLTEQAEISENYVQIGSGGGALSVAEVSVKGDRLFALTSEGIQTGNLNQNLLDFNNWNRLSGTANFTEMTLVQDQLYMLNGTDLAIISVDAWSDAGIELPVSATNLYSSGGHLLTSTSNGDIFQLNSVEFSLIAKTSAMNINDLKRVGDEFYIADGVKGLVNEKGDRLWPDGPLSNVFSNVKVIAGQVFGFHAPSPFRYTGLDQVDGYSFFSDGRWETPTLPDFKNITDVTSSDGDTYFTSIGDGLLKVSGSDQSIETISSSSTSSDTLLTALRLGVDGMWVVGFSEQEPVHFLDNAKVWSSFSSSLLSGSEFLSIDVSQTGIAWLGSSSGEITILDRKQSIVDQLSTLDGLPSDYSDIAISIEDNAWVGTTRGPALFPDASFVLSNSFAIQPTFENRALFEGEVINAVMTDGGNRIWFGTDRGLWVFDDNTSKQVALFNQSNSPIPSNRILRLAYNGRNGEVFIVTDKGMVSFRSASSNGNRDHRNVSIFPNPVRPDFNGMVGIDGLAKNAILKITDINGNLVQELNANGGSASWNLQDLRGGRVVTGIYFFFSSSTDGVETFVGKIAVVR